MNLKLSGVGADPKKVAMLGGLVLVAGYFYFSNRNPGGSAVTPTSTGSSSALPEAPAPSSSSQRTSARSRPRVLQRGGAISSLEFHPSLKPKKDVDRATIDPTLKLDLLARVQNVKIEGGSRSLFESGAAPEAAAAGNVTEPKKIVPQFAYFGPPAPPPPKTEADGPPPPPIPLKFYGFINPAAKAAAKRAFFLDGDDIIVATEGQLVKSRYKIIRIGLNSADVEDTQFKNHRETLPLVQEQQS